MAKPGATTNEDIDDLKAEPTASIIQRRWEEGGNDLTEARRAWWINSCFVEGEQWLRWDRHRGSVIQMETDVERVRITGNLLEDDMASLMGRLTGKPIRFEDRPTAADDATVAAAKLAENVLNTAHDEHQWEEVRAAEILDAYLGGCSLVYFDWDPAGGETIEYDEGTDRVVGTGEVRLASLPVTDFVLQRGVRDPYASAYWVAGVAMGCTEAQRRYKMAKRPAADAFTGKSPLMQRLISEQGKGAPSDSCLVLTCWQPPKDNTKGWVATVVGEEIVDGPHDWPFPFKDLNFAVFEQRKRTGCWWGSTALNGCIALQVAFNCVLSAIVEACKQAGSSFLAVDDLSYETMLNATDDPGEMRRYSSASGGPPVWVSGPGPGRGLREEAENLANKIHDKLSVHDISRGDVNVNRTPASTIAQLAEKDDSPLGRFAHNQSVGWSRLGRLILKTYEAKVTETRTAKVGRKGSATAEWNGKRLRGQTNVSVPLQVTKPFSRAATWQQAMDLVDRQILAPGSTKFFELVNEDPEDWIATISPDVERAKRENVKMAAGEVEFPAGYDDHHVHIAEHNAFRKSAAYDELVPQVKLVIDDHVQAHETIAHEEAGIQAAKAGALPASNLIPQADAPAGSGVPLPFDQQQALAAQSAGQAPPPPMA